VSLYVVVMYVVINFSEQDVRTEPLYSVVDVNHEIDEDKVYGRLVDLRPNIKVGVLRSCVRVSE